jgi:hypothetical protein
MRDSASTGLSKSEACGHRFSCCLEDNEETLHSAEERRTVV